MMAVLSIIVLTSDGHFAVCASGHRDEITAALRKTCPRKSGGNCMVIVPNITTQLDVPLIYVLVISSLKITGRSRLLWGRLIAKVLRKWATHIPVGNIVVDIIPVPDAARVRG